MHSSELTSCYNNNGNLANSIFTYLNKVNKPRISKVSHMNFTEIFHNLRILINLGLHDRTTRLIMDTLIMKGFTFGGKFKLLIFDVMRMPG